jgi:hypothetical protein
MKSMTFWLETSCASESPTFRRDPEERTLHSYAPSSEIFRSKWNFICIISSSTSIVTVILIITHNSR